MAALAEPWHACLELAWEAYRAGSVPVGAVVVDGAGAIVARGRNRVHEPAGDGLSGTRLAHAEVDALVRLPVTALYPDHTLYSSLEPCLLCLGAVLMSTVGTIRYAADDPGGGACRIEIRLPDFGGRGPESEGLLDGWLPPLSQALSAAFWLGHPRGASLVAAYGPEVEAAGRRIAGLADPGETLEEALPRLLEVI